MSAKPILNFEELTHDLATGNLTALQAKLEAARKRLSKQGVSSEPAYQCPVCQDRGVIAYDVPVGHALFGKLEPCTADVCPTRDERQRKRQAMLLEKSGIHDSEMAEWTLEAWDARVEAKKAHSGKREARAVAELFVFEVEPKTGARVDWNRTHNVGLIAANRMAGRKLTGKETIRNSIVLQGDYGLGKTGLAVAIVQALIEAGEAPLYIRWQDFLDELKDRMGRSDVWKSAHDDTYEDRIRLVERSQVLIVDDLNLEIDGNWRREIAERVFRYRKNKKLPTLVTCNSSREDLEKQWGRRAMEALFEMAHYVRLGGAPIRDTSQVPENVEPF